ncbi:MAG: hypothetical protein UU10_C0022G0009 [Parcubacteria group bacterium GW2011_GWF1_40_6]|nr:MAG: hypothetical protein UU10_C0022G0009 [Parcubacteria group bacterium GW2011_GWF1_40_6]
MFIMGKLEGQKLFNPRQYALVQTSPGRFQHHLSPPPAAPAFIHLPKDIFYYPIADGELSALYTEATTGIKIANPLIGLVR